MGIQGLLSLLKPATDEIHIRKYAGKVVAVDTYCWLHKGSFACADKLAKGEYTDQYVVYCMKYVDMLLKNDVRPILVFDGCHLPSKKEVEQQRNERRKQYMSIGKQFLREGKASQARDAFTKCISVTHLMALEVMKAARARGVECIVAPYEADSQLAFLLKSGYADAVVTEDSDLLCFGCSKVILKLDLTGRAHEICLENLGRVKNLIGFTPEMLRHMCILSGCDYLKNIKNVGLGKACKVLKVAKSKHIYDAVRKLHQYVKGLAPVDASYSVGFEKADKTFKYQLVMDPKLRKLVPLNEYESGVCAEELEYAGPLIADARALDIAIGNINVNTGKKIEDFDIDKWLEENTENDKCSIWHGDNTNYKPGLKITTSNKPRSFESKRNQSERPFWVDKNKQAPANESTAGKEKTIKIGKLFQHVAKSKAKTFSSEEVLKQINNDETEMKQNKSIVKSSTFKPPEQQNNKIIKSRFFERRKRHENETNNIAVTITNTVMPAKSNDDALTSILDELSEVTKVEVKSQNDSSSAENSKKRKRSSTVSLKSVLDQYRKDNELRTPLKSPSPVKGTGTRDPDTLTPPSPKHTPKRKRLSKTSLTYTNILLPEKQRTPKKLRKVVKPPPDGASFVCQKSSPEVKFPDEEKQLINVSTESIPILDKYNALQHKCESPGSEIMPCEVSIEDCIPVESPIKKEQKIVHVISDQEQENINITLKNKERKGCENGNKKAEVKRKVSSKTSKYFSGSKASGLRKTSQKQPTLFSMFRKSTTKSVR